jgi:hypothetical protein
MREPGTRPAVLLQLACHWLMGMALGVLCAGLLLITKAPEVVSLVGASASAHARLIFLVSVGISFGFSATLTGAIFLLNEDPSLPLTKKPRPGVKRPIVDQSTPARSEANAVPNGQRRQSGTDGWRLGILLIITVILIIGWGWSASQRWQWDRAGNDQIADVPPAANAPDSPTESTNATTSGAGRTTSRASRPG